MSRVTQLPLPHEELPVVGGLKTEEGGSKSPNFWIEAFGQSITRQQSVLEPITSPQTCVAGFVLAAKQPTSSVYSPLVASHRQAKHPTPVLGFTGSPGNSSQTEHAPAPSQAA